MVSNIPRNALCLRCYPFSNQIINQIISQLIVDFRSRKFQFGMNAKNLKAFLLFNDTMKEAETISGWTLVV